MNSIQFLNLIDRIMIECDNLQFGEIGFVKRVKVDNFIVIKL